MIEAPTEVQDTEMVAPKAKPPKPVGATLDSALARQARAKKNLALVEVQLTSMQQKMEEARAEMALADKAVNEAQTAGCPGHRDLRRGSGTGVAAAAPATSLRPGGTRSVGENDGCANEHEGNATSAAAGANADNTDDADSHSGIGAFPKVTGHAGSSAARSYATEHCSWTKPARFKNTPRDWRTTLARSGRR